MASYIAKCVLIEFDYFSEPAEKVQLRMYFDKPLLQKFHPSILSYPLCGTQTMNVEIIILARH